MKQERGFAFEPLCLIIDERDGHPHHIRDTPDIPNVKLAAVLETSTR